MLHFHVLVQLKKLVSPPFRLFKEMILIPKQVNHFSEKNKTNPQKNAKKKSTKFQRPDSTNGTIPSSKTLNPPTKIHLPATSLQSQISSNTSNTAPQPPKTRTNQKACKQAISPQ